MTEEQRSFVKSVNKKLNFLESEKKWYVIRTLPRWEKKVVTLLQTKNIDHYCPLNKVTKQWSDRKKVVFEPLFKSYVFINIPEDLLWVVAKYDGVLNYIYHEKKPAVVQKNDILNIRKFLNEFTDVSVTDIDNSIKVNELVVIKQGVFMDYKGIVLEVNNNKAKVNIVSMGIVLTAFFDKKNIEKL